MCLPNTLNESQNKLIMFTFDSYFCMNSVYTVKQWEFYQFLEEYDLYKSYWGWNKRQIIEIICSSNKFNWSGQSYVKMWIFCSVLNTKILNWQLVTYYDIWQLDDFWKVILE